MTVEAKPNQGMRQPQLGGIASQLRLARPNPLCGHAQFWRLTPGHPWVCMTCHPPAVERYETSEV